MSWSLSVPASKPEEFADAVATAFENWQSMQDASTKTEAEEQAVEAIKIAQRIVHESQVVGSQDKHFSATLAGHANPGHEPREGYANDYISVAVYQQNAPIGS